MIDVQEAGLERHVTREGSSRWTVRAKREITYDVLFRDSFLALATRHWQQWEMFLRPSQVRGGLW